MHCSLASLSVQVLILLKLGVAFADWQSDAQAKLSYYTREKCVEKGFLPDWSSKDYQPSTHFEKLFKSPLNIDLIAASHSSNSSGFEQVTADWGCQFDQCYGQGECNEIGFYGPGAKDPSGGGCAKGPIKAYEDLTCAIRLGLADNNTAFEDFCNGNGDSAEGLYECISFLANVITESGAFAETEERDPRPYCWDRSEGNTECCPAGGKCLEDSDSELSPDQYPADNAQWLGNTDRDDKCCSYHGRGFLQVSYEPNYKALSLAMVGDEKLFWHYPHKLDSDGVAGWTAALWFWFNEHPAQVYPVDPEEANQNPDKVAQWTASPREKVLDWESGYGFPSSINVINGGECGNFFGSQTKALNRASYFFAIAHRLNAKPPKSKLGYYPLPGTQECEDTPFCKLQFHNPDSECPLFANNLDCASTSPYNVNASTPVGFNRLAIKLTQTDGQTPTCTWGAVRLDTPEVWKAAQADFTPIPDWEKMLEINRDNVCSIVQQLYTDENGNQVEGNSSVCSTMCGSDFSLWDNEPCTQPQKPCQFLGYYVSSPLPANSFMTGNMGDYHGGAYLGRTGPGLVMALNGKYGFRSDYLCYWFGGTECAWNIGLGNNPKPSNIIKSCRVRPAGVSQAALDWTDAEDNTPTEKLKPGEFPAKMTEALKYYDPSTCPTTTGDSVLEQLFPRGPIDMDKLVSMTFSQNDGFDNLYYETGEANSNVNKLGYGKKGPQLLWDNMLCAFNKGIPTDPDLFQRDFGRDVSWDVGASKTLTGYQKRFAMMEFLAFFANVIKETGALGQQEEQDPREYCNHMGGPDNSCCPNEWGNNPMCYTSTTPDNTIIPPEEMRRALGTNATCCTYHGRGPLQVSYEKNYGDVAAQMLMDPNNDIDMDLARRFGVNFPQFIDAFGVSGWTSAFLFWLGGRPCQYCYGSFTNSTADYSAPVVSPHSAMVDWQTPGSGLGLTFAIINGQECEAASKAETEVSWQGSQMRLALFYNLAYRFNAAPPQEDIAYYPLPGTKECDGSPWCQGTFFAAQNQSATYRGNSGACWALTPQPADASSSYWTYCVPQRVQGGSRWGSTVDTVSFSMTKTEGSCEILQKYTCGVKKISNDAKPSMSDSEFAEFTEWKEPMPDHDRPGFKKYMGMDADTLCGYVKDKDPKNFIPAGSQDCNFWCTSTSGVKGQCTLRDEKTCLIRGSGLPFVECANEVFQGYLKQLASDCYIPLDTDDDNELPTPKPPKSTTKAAVTTTTKAADPTTSSSSSSSSSTKAAPAPAPAPAPTPSGGGGADPLPPTPDSTDGCYGCSACVSSSGTSWDDNSCAKCRFGVMPHEWPCSNKGFCKCKAGSQATTPKSCQAVGCTACAGFSSQDDGACASCRPGSSSWPCMTVNKCYCSAF